MSTTLRPELAELQIADPPDRWEALGFAVRGASTTVGGITIRLGGSGEGITSWAIRNVATDTDIAGLPTTAPDPGRPAADDPVHPNTVTAIDHVVVVTPDFDATAEALNGANMPLRRIRDTGSFRQGFRRLGPAILELVEATGSGGELPQPRFWGLVFIAGELELLAARLGERLGPIRPAVQPGRQIATLRENAGLGPRVAFMDPEPVLAAGSRSGVRPPAR